MSILEWIINIFRPRPKPPEPKPPTPPPVPPPVPANRQQELLNAHNQERAARNISPLVMNAKLNAAAQKHANWMAANRKMSHDQNGVPFTTRLTAEGYHFWSAGENIAMGQPTVQAVMTAWMNSPGHRANILKAQYREAGFGIATADGRVYWCVDFGAQMGMEGFAAHEPGVWLSGPLGPTDETLAIAHLT